MTPVFADEVSTQAQNSEQAAVQTTQTKTQTKNLVQEKEKDLKTNPLKSFFSKFSRKNKKVTKQTEIPVVNEVPIINGSIVYNMDDCIKIGLKNSPTVKNLKQTLSSQKNEINIAKSNYFPVIFAGTGYNYGVTRYSERSITTPNKYGVDVGLSAMIWDFGRTVAKINMSKFNYEAAGYDLKDGILNTVFDIKLAYTEVLSARANTDVLLQNVKINELNVERTKAMYEVGLKSKIDLVNAEVSLTEAEISLFNAQNTYQSALIALNSAMYYINPPQYSITPTDTFNFQRDDTIKNEINVAYEKKSYNDNEEIPVGIKEGSIFTAGIEKKNFITSYKFDPFALSLQEAIDKAFADRYDLKSIKLLEKASEESLKAVKRNNYPQLNVSAKYSLGVNASNVANQDNGNVSNGVTLYGGLDLPNTNPMLLKNQIEIAKSNVEVAKNNVVNMENNIYFEIQDLYVNMKQLEQKIPLMRRRVQQSLENFELADGRYAVGLGDYIELQQALTNYNNAQLSFIESVFLYNKARFELERAMATEYNY